MLTLDALRAWGAHVDEGLARCMNMEVFYLKLVSSLKDDTKVEELKAALDREDWEAAFDTAHGLKGVYANLALTPMLTPVARISDSLKTRAEADYAPLMDELLRQKEKFDALF